MIFFFNHSLKCFAIQLGRSLEIPILGATLTMHRRSNPQLKEHWCGFPKSALSYERTLHFMRYSWALFRAHSYVSNSKRTLGEKWMITCMNAGGSGHWVCVVFVNENFIIAYIFALTWIFAIVWNAVNRNMKPNPSSKTFVNFLSILYMIFTWFIYDWFNCVISFFFLCWPAKNERLCVFPLFSFVFNAVYCLWRPPFFAEAGYYFCNQINIIVKLTRSFQTIIKFARRSFLLLPCLPLLSFSFSVSNLYLLFFFSFILFYSIIFSQTYKHHYATMPRYHRNQYTCKYELFYFVYSFNVDAMQKFNESLWISLLHALFSAIAST